MGAISFRKIAKGEETLEEASAKALEEQEEKFKDPKARRRFGLRGKTPEEQREIDEKSAQGDPESKG